jgi:SAM-dependent methyltransferase
MQMRSPEFDRFSSSYDDLLKDPLRDRFSGSDSLFFHQRKSDLIRRFFRRRKLDTSRLSYLDVGCGKGELVTLLRGDFARTAGCDVSTGMMTAIDAVETRVQTDPVRIPFDDSEFDFITTVCVYHHVPLEARLSVTAEIFRVLRPGGIFCMIEHNPLNPVTRTIVGRAPVDTDATLLRAREGRSLASQTAFVSKTTEYFLYFPKNLYRFVGALEPWLAKIPLGGQYAIFSEKGGRGAA